MATYAISFLTGDVEQIDAARIEWDIDDRTFRALDTDGEILLVAPFATVRSIRRTATSDRRASTMAMYRKKPVEIEARQLVGTNAEMQGVYLWIEENIWSVPPPCDDEQYSAPSPGVTIDPADGRIVIRTLEGDMKADLGDWIIKGVQGEFYPCKPDIFAATYEPVN